MIAGFAKCMENHKEKSVLVLEGTAAGGIRRIMDLPSIE